MEDSYKDKSVPDIYEEIESESTLLGRLAKKIPGFGGYVERSRRRQADKLLRETIAGRLEQTRLELSLVHQELSRDIIKAIDFAEPLGSVDSKLMGLIGKIRDAPQGYSGFFDATKVDAEDLSRLYHFDENMLHYANAIADEVSALHEAVHGDGDIGARIDQLDMTVQQANSAFSSRQEILTGVA